VTERLDLVLLWHMHQPDYRDPASGEFLFPWVYLHAIKDYADMAAHLERHPQVRATINLVPVLLDQLEDYADQFATAVIRCCVCSFIRTRTA
jgi:alpha-amylase/alpha-mannosidase (GH57 family)